MEMFSVVAVNEGTGIVVARDSFGALHAARSGAGFPQAGDELSGRLPVLGPAELYGAAGKVYPLIWEFLDCDAQTVRLLLKHEGARSHEDEAWIETTARAYIRKDGSI